MAALRRIISTRTLPTDDGTICLDIAHHIVSRSGVVVHLRKRARGVRHYWQGPLALRVFMALYAAWPHKLRLHEIISFVWDDPDTEPEIPEEVIGQVIHRLRRNFGLERIGVSISTRLGRGSSGYGLEFSPAMSEVIAA